MDNISFAPTSQVLLTRVRWIGEPVRTTPMVCGPRQIGGVTANVRDSGDTTHFKGIEEVRWNPQGSCVISQRLDNNLQSLAFRELLLYKLKGGLRSTE